MTNREIDDRGLNTSDEREPQLTTKDVAAGAAAARRAQNIEANSESAAARENGTALFDNRETEDFRAHWNRIQTQFVDEPRRSVEQADELVAQTMKRLAEIFAQERENLEQEWDRGDQVSTEDLRIALQRYRTFFDRLLTV